MYLVLNCSTILFVSLTVLHIIDYSKKENIFIFLFFSSPHPKEHDKCLNRILLAFQQTLTNVKITMPPEYLYVSVLGLEILVGGLY